MTFSVQIMYFWEKIFPTGKTCLRLSQRSRVAQKLTHCLIRVKSHRYAKW